IEKESPLKMQKPKSKTILSRAIIKSAPRQLLHQGHGVAASIYRVEIEGQQIAIKDFEGTPPMFRALIAPYLVRRETRALQRLQGVPGVPIFYGRIDRLAFALELVEGKPVSELSKKELTEEMFIRIQQTIDGIHERKVSHGDLKRRTNFLVTADGR